MKHLQKDPDILTQTYCGLDVSSGCELVVEVTDATCLPCLRGECSRLMKEFVSVVHRMGEVRSGDRTEKCAS